MYTIKVMRSKLLSKSSIMRLNNWKSSLLTAREFIDSVRAREEENAASRVFSFELKTLKDSITDFQEELISNTEQESAVRYSYKFSN